MGGPLSVDLRTRIFAAWQLREATTYVCFGAGTGERAYVGITHDIVRRLADHGGRFAAVDQPLIDRNPGFENIRNSISPNHSCYDEAVEWGEAWLRGAGY